MFLDKLNEVLASEKSFISDRLNSIGFGVSAIINIIHWLLLYSKIKPTSSRILLHYNVLYGPDWINSSWFIYAIPSLSLVILFINFWVASRFYKNEKLSAYFISSATIAVQLIFFIASVVLITINA